MMPDRSRLLPWIACRLAWSVDVVFPGNPCPELGFGAQAPSLHFLNGSLKLLELPVVFFLATGEFRGSFGLFGFPFAEPLHECLTALGQFEASGFDLLQQPL